MMKDRESEEAYAVLSLPSAVLERLDYFASKRGVSRHELIMHYLASGMRVSWEQLTRQQQAESKLTFEFLEWMRAHKHSGTLS